MFLNEKERSETIWACRFCMMCQVADRVGEVMCRESNTPRGRGAIANALEKGFLEWSPEVADILYTTLNDGRLQEWCVGNYDHEELMIDFRAKLFDKGLVPEEIEQLINRLNNGRGINRENIIETLKKEGVELDDNADTCLYIGCDDIRGTEQTIINMGRLLNIAGVSFKILSDEPCCGHSLYQAGDFEGATLLSKNIIEKFHSSGVTNVVVMDADCFRMFTTRTKRFGGDVDGFNFEHCTMILDNLLKTNRIKVQTSTAPQTVTYQDPCSLTRYCSQAEAPRRVLSAIGITLKEMDPSGKSAFCCGKGGLLAEYKPEVALEVAKLRCAEAAETEADMLVTACFGCHDMLEKGAKASNGSEVPAITHIVDLVAKAVVV